MKYFFVLGNNAALSIAELSAVFGLNEKKQNYFQILNSEILALERKEKIIAKKIIKKLGGTIKIGEIITEISKGRDARIIEETKKLLNFQEKKLNFGFSYYGRQKFNEKQIAMEIKKYLRQNNISCRWVASKEKTLSSVVVEQNKLIDNGIEIILIEADKKLFLGKTLAVQPFKELSYRDYGRPRRDDRSGMLPPKLAQIMINLSGAKLTDVVLDPFCGSGTILSEALLAGYKNIIGTDILKKAVNGSKLNIDWLKKKSKIFNLPARAGNYKLKIFQANAAELGEFIPPRSVNAIITEPYLGPQRGKINYHKTIAELENLYSKALAEFKKILNPKGRAVIIFPIFNTNRSARNINPDLNGYKILNPIPKNLLGEKNIRLTKRNTIIYGRPGQKIWREILVLSTMKQ